MGLINSTSKNLVESSTVSDNSDKNKCNTYNTIIIQHNNEHSNDITNINKIDFNNQLTSKFNNCIDICLSLLSILPCKIDEHNKTYYNINYISNKYSTSDLFKHCKLDLISIIVSKFSNAQYIIINNENRLYADIPKFKLSKNYFFKNKNKIRKMKYKLNQLLSEKINDIIININDETLI